MTLQTRYMGLLPSIYQEGMGDEKSPYLIERYLSIFEEILTGTEYGMLTERKSFAQMLDIISDIFYPRFSFLKSEKGEGFMPEFTEKRRGEFARYFSTDVDDFLTWMAGWMALVIKQDWGVEKKREVIARIIPIYKIRGTKEGLERYLQIYAGRNTSVTEFMDPFQVGFTSTVGSNSIVGEGRPYYFEVHIYLPLPDPAVREKEEKAVREIIEMEKPAHTYYDLKVHIPTLKVGTYSTVGEDTLLWEE